MISVTLGTTVDTEKTELLESSASRKGIKARKGMSKKTINYP